MSEVAEKKEKSKELELSIRATNNAVWDTEKFDNTDKVSRVRDRSVKHFIKKSDMSEGEYDLCILKGGVAQPALDPSARLKDADVHNHSKLVLVAKKPQVDG